MSDYRTEPGEYVVELCGCDDSTAKVLHLTASQLEVIEWLRDQLNPLAGGCKPKLRLMTMPEAEADEFTNVANIRKEQESGNPDWREWE